MTKYREFELLELELLRFSKYKEFDEEKEGISCPIAIQKLQKEKNKKGIDKKYVIVFIIFEGKIIKTTKERLDKLNIDVFNSYMYDKKRLRVVAYLFDTKNNNKRFKQFLSKITTFDSIFEKAKKTILNYKYLLSFVGIIFSALVLYFVYTGLGAYGIVPQKMMGIQEVYFLMLFTLLSLVIVVFLVYLLVPILSPFLLAFWLIGYFSLKMSLLNILVLSLGISVIFLIFLYIFSKIKPLSVDNFFHETKTLIPVLAVTSSIIMIIGIIATIGIPSMSSVVTHNFSRHSGKSNYGMVMYIYQDIYSGYPKILINNAENKIYYLPFESGGYYFIYNVDEVRKNYFNDLNKTKEKRTLLENNLCVKNQMQEDFINMYIIDNFYIKPKYQTKRFSVNDKNITIEEFNNTKLISVDDINKSLCNGTMK